MMAEKERKGTRVTFLDQTGAKSVEAVIADNVNVARILPNIITKMSLPVTGPDGQPMSYSLDHKEGGKRLTEDQTLPAANVKEGDHLIVYPEIVAGGWWSVILLTGAGAACLPLIPAVADQRDHASHGARRCPPPLAPGGFSAGGC
jgi:hypothetical protein